MNHRGGWALIKSSWASWMQYRSFFFLLAFGWMIPPLIYLFVWSTAAGESTIGGLSRGEFVTYYLALILVNQLTYAQTNWTVGDLIRMGSMNVLLLRPIAPLFNTLASELAGKGVTLLDAPISGGQVGAIAGTLAIMVGVRARHMIRPCRCCKRWVQTLPMSAALALRLRSSWPTT